MKNAKTASILGLPQKQAPKVRLQTEKKTRHRPLIERIWYKDEC